MCAMHNYNWIELKCAINSIIVYFIHVSLLKTYRALATCALLSSVRCCGIVYGITIQAPSLVFHILSTWVTISFRDPVIGSRLSVSSMCISPSNIDVSLGSLKNVSL